MPPSIARTSSDSPPSVSIVVPVYNSEQIVPLLVDEIDRVRTAAGLDAELILVNDGSRDESWEAVRTACEGRSWVRAINLARNYGQHNAILCGVRAAKGSITVTMDDDLQHPPGEIPRVVDALGDEWDVAYGKPMKEQHGLWRDLASQVTKIALQSTMGLATARDVSAFRAFRTSVRDSFAAYHGNFVSMDVLLTWGTTKFTSVKVRHDPRHSGPSNYTFRQLLTHAVNLLTGFSVLPLQLASFSGFAMMLFGMFVLGFVLFRFFSEGQSVAGFPFLASIIALFGGSQLFALGIMGEYLARIHSRSMERPPYVVGEEYRQSPDESV